MNIKNLDPFMDSGNKQHRQQQISENNKNNKLYTTSTYNMNFFADNLQEFQHSPLQSHQQSQQQQQSQKLQQFFEQQQQNFPRQTQSSQSHNRRNYKNQSQQNLKANNFLQGETDSNYNSRTNFFPNFQQKQLQQQQLQQQQLEINTHPMDPGREFQKQIQTSKNTVSYGQYVDIAPLIKRNLMTPQLQHTQFDPIFSKGIQPVQKKVKSKGTELISNRALKLNQFANQEQFLSSSKNINTEKLMFQQFKQKENTVQKTANDFKKQNQKQQQQGIRPKLPSTHQRTKTLIDNFAKNLYRNDGEEKLGQIQQFQQVQVQEQNKVVDNEKLFKNGEIFSHDKTRVRDKKPTFIRDKELYGQNTKSKSINELDKFKQIQTKVNYKLPTGYKKVVVIETFNLENAKRSLNLNYCYIDLPYIDEKNEESAKGRKKIKEEFEEFKKVLIKKLKLTQSKKLYLYLRDGVALQSHYQVPQFENVLFATHQVTFRGIDNIFASNKQINLLKDIMLELEDKVQSIYNKEMRKKDLENYKKDKNYETEYFKNGKFLDLMTIQQNQMDKKVHKLDFKNMFSVVEVKGVQEDLGNIDLRDPYSGSLLYFKNLFQLQDYMRTIGGFLDMFFAHNDIEWRQEKEQMEVDLYVESIKEYEKENQLKVSMDDALSRLEKRRGRQKKIKQQNQEQFAQSINRLSKTFNEQLMQQRKKQESILSPLQQQQNSAKRTLRKMTSKESQFSKYQPGNTGSSHKRIQTQTTESDSDDIGLLQSPRQDKEVYIKPNEVNIVYILYRALLDVVSYMNSIEDIIKYGYNCNAYNGDTSYIQSKKQMLKDESREMTEEELKNMQDEIVELEDKEKQNLIEGMCDFEHIINWGQTLQIIQKLAQFTPQQRTAILMTVADEDRSGTLDRQEVEDLCFMVMNRMINEEYVDYKKELVSYFTNLFFSCMMMGEYAEEDEYQNMHKSQQQVSMTTIKQAILKGREENDLLCFFCAASVSGSKHIVIEEQ